MVLAAGMWVFGTYLVYWLFGPNYEQSILPARILFLSVPFLFLGLVSSIAANALHLEHKIVKILSLSVAINLGLNVYVIPKYGIVGAAWVTVISQIIWASGMLILAIPILLKPKPNA